MPSSPDSALTTSDPLLRPIRTRSKRHALDWCLVLASQGIFCTLHSEPAEHGWLLFVRQEEYDRAVEAIQQFRRENRGRVRWTPSSEQFQFQFLPAILWALLLLLVYAGQTAAPQWVWRLGVLDSSAARAGEWWRVGTAVFLHGDPTHLVSNIMLGLVLFPAAIGIYGVTASFLVTWAAAAFANLAVLAARPGPYLALGSSGMIMAALGLLAARAFPHQSAPSAGPSIMRPILFASILLFVLFGTDPHSDVLTHLISLIFGILLGVILPHSVRPKA